MKAEAHVDSVGGRKITKEGSHGVGHPRRFARAVANILIHRKVPHATEVAAIPGDSAKCGRVAFERARAGRLPRDVADSDVAASYPAS